MSDANTLHNQAMEVAEEATVQRIRGNTDHASELFRVAFEMESRAAFLTAETLTLEPTRSVLCRSAASLALECNEPREAERLIAVALSGNPPNEIANELRDLLEQVHLQRHLDLRGIVLEPNEFQVSIAGNAIGFGVAGSEVFISRVQDLEKLVFRTAERQAKRPFRDRGRRQGALSREVEMFLSVPRAASFAVSFRIGHGEQQALPGLAFGDAVINEMLDCVELFNAADARSLRERIPDLAYYRNFVSLVRSISPDGDAVRAVGFTALSAGQERRVVLARPTSEEPPSFTDLAGVAQRESVVARGTLKFADARKEAAGFIVLVDSRRKPHKVRVPAGMMDDIVRPLWDFDVVVRGVRHLGVIDLVDIRKAESVVEEDV